MTITPLKDIPQDVRRQLTGRNFNLPRARGASEPFYFDGVGVFPYPAGTKISRWYLSPSDPLNYSYWVPGTVKEGGWPHHAGVYRIRKSQPEPSSKEEGELVVHIARLATAMERIADALSNT